MTKGKFITFYGINGLGKSTQRERVSEELKRRNNVDVVHVKYPVYFLTPTGPRINDYLRNGNPQGLTPHDHQALQIENRKDFQPTLTRMLISGIWVVAEDYIMTGICWGI